MFDSVISTYLFCNQYPCKSHHPGVTVGVCGVFMSCRQSAIFLLSRQEREALAPFTAGQSMWLIVVECGIGVTTGCLAPVTTDIFAFGN